MEYTVNHFAEPYKGKQNHSRLQISSTAYTSFARLLAIIRPPARICKFGYISQTLIANGLFLICILCKTFKEQKRLQTFSSSQPISKVCRIERHAAVKLLSKNFLINDKKERKNRY